MLKGIELVKARGFKYETHKASDGSVWFSASCAGDGCLLKSASIIKSDSLIDKTVMETLNAFADILDPIYEDIKLYDDEDSLEVIAQKLEGYKYVEASNWALSEENDGRWKVSCCSEHPEKTFTTLLETLQSLSVYPDQYVNVMKPRYTEPS